MIKIPKYLFSVCHTIFKLIALKIILNVDQLEDFYKQSNALDIILQLYLDFFR
jgi:hypothetical protein